MTLGLFLLPITKFLYSRTMLKVLVVLGLAGVSDGELLRAAHHGSHWHCIKNTEQPAADERTGPDKDSGRVCLTDALYSQRSRRQP